MASLFHLSDETEEPDKISLDELYEGKQKRDLRVLKTFKTILSRIHNKIKVTARQQIDQQFCWFVVPEFMLGVPSYNHNECVVYLVEQLIDNGFRVKYTHPNLLLISWNHWVPDYVRQELKKKTGVEVDGQGNFVKKGEVEQDLTGLPFATQQSKKEEKEPEKEYRDIKTYNPRGGLVYKDSLLKDLQNRFNS